MDAEPVIFAQRNPYPVSVTSSDIYAHAGPEADEQEINLRREMPILGGAREEGSEGSSSADGIPRLATDDSALLDVHPPPPSQQQEQEEADSVLAKRGEPATSDEPWIEPPSSKRARVEEANEEVPPPPSSDAVIDGPQRTEAPNAQQWAPAEGSIAVAQAEASSQQQQQQQDTTEPRPVSEKGGGGEGAQQAEQMYSDMRARAAAQAAAAVGLPPEMAHALSMLPAVGAGGSFTTGAGGGSLAGLCELGQTPMSASSAGAAVVVSAAPAFEPPEAAPLVPAVASDVCVVADDPQGEMIGTDPAVVGILATAEGTHSAEHLIGGETFTCTVCRKVFKREMNLVFHMTTHRPRSTEPAEPSENASTKCQDCGKVFATKYQAKKHYLRRHFSGDKPFACSKCGKKRFVVREDLTMHMKSCGNVYVCKCGIRLCSLGALKRHCKYFEHVRLVAFNLPPLRPSTCPLSPYARTLVEPSPASTIARIPPPPQLARQPLPHSQLSIVSTAL